MDYATASYQLIDLIHTGVEYIQYTQKVLRHLSREHLNLHIKSIEIYVLF